MDSKSTNQKKRAVVSFENMSEELAAAFAEKYPKGFNDYFPDPAKMTSRTVRVSYAVTLEIPDAIYLVKIKVKTDDADDIERWLDGDDDDAEGAGDNSEGEDLPDDNIAQYATGDDDPADSE